LTLIMKAIFCSVTSVDFQRTIRRYIPKDCILSFIYGRLNEDTSIATLLVLCQIIGRSLINELQETWKQKVVALTKVLFRNVRGGVLMTLKNVSYDNQYPGRVMNTGPTGHETEVLSTRLRRSVEIS
jgi:hypothetical protein